MARGPRWRRWTVKSPSERKPLGSVRVTLKSVGKISVTPPSRSKTLSSNSPVNIALVAPSKPVGGPLGVGELVSVERKVRPLPA